MPMSPDEVAELSRLLDEALALEPALREPWLGDLERTKPRVARRLRGMLRHTETSHTGVLPKLPPIDADDAVATAGERVGSYRLVREIGRGGMGSVWLAERADGSFKRRVALKLPRLAWATGLGKRMARERDIGALLEHPNIARLYDAGVDEHGRPYIAMEYIDGQPIDVYCREHALDLRARLKLFVEVAHAVAYAHGRLVLHRDLKPANVLVDSGGHVHLLDFGIAKLLDETAALGSDFTEEQGRVLSLNYASPEQIAGRPLGVTADVYSLGVVLFELLTGELPYTFKRNTVGAIEDAILAGDTPLASRRVADRRLAREVRGDIDAILAKAIKQDAADRYPTAEALASDIDRYLEGQAIAARPDSRWYRLRKLIVRRRAAVAAGSAVLVVALVGGTSTLLQTYRAAEEAERARMATAFVTDLFRVNALNEVPMSDGAARPDRPILIDRGAELIEARFKGQPTLQAELYGAVGRVYVDLGVDRKANLYAARQLEILRAQSASAIRIARSLILMSEAALSATQNEDAAAHAQEALALLPANDPLVPDALALQARAQVSAGKFEEAQASVARGRQMLMEQGRPRSLAGAWLRFVEGSLLARMNKFADAIPVVEAAFEEADQVEVGTSRAAAEMRLWLAIILIENNRAEEGRPLAKNALASLEKSGGLGSVRAAQWRADLAAAQYGAGSMAYEETVTEFEEVSRYLRSLSPGVPEEVIASVDFARGRAFMERGEYELAKPLIDSSAVVLRQATQNSRKLYLMAGFSGECAMYMGDHATADRILRQSLQLQTKLFSADHPWAAYDWIAIAFNLAMQGHHLEAQVFLSKAPNFGKVQGAKGDKGPLVPLTLSRILLDSGDVHGAWQAFPQVEIGPDYEDSGTTSSYYQLRGELRCASGDYKNGLFDLTRSIKSQATLSGPNHPWLARARSVAGLCALAQGYRELAAELAEASRRAFVAQPGVSPYFKEPLVRLEQQLRPKSS